jgi:hypothetical protein
MKYIVRGYSSRDGIEDGASYENEWNTLKEARCNAKRIITSEFNLEYQCNLAYSRVIDFKTGECINDYFA